MNKIQKKILMPFVLAAALSFSGCYFFPNEEPVLEPPTLDVEKVVYSTYTVGRKDIESAVIQSGYVISASETDCYFNKYSGQLKNIYVNPGDFVEEGQLVAEMNNGTIEYQLKVQQKKVELAQLNYNNSHSAVDKLQLDIEQSTLESYQDQYDGGRIYAPVSGQVSFVKTLNPGDMVDPYDVLVKIIDPDKLCVRAEVTGSGGFSADDPVTVEVNGDIYEGVVVRTPKEELEEGDGFSDAVFVEFTKESPGFGCLGSIGNIKKVKASSLNTLVIPKYVIKTDGDRQYVQILKNDEKTEVDITTGVSNAVEIEVLSGLSEGDKVISR
ncbi:MAG TPA: hypothetical protein DDX91_06325 [Ruminococcaceae bacterium]|nr:hypothetical protein [Oscillospiraceae bacterium]